MTTRNTNGVPATAHGLWKRDEILLADGSSDRTTRVYWAQTRSRYIDLRVPAERPASSSGRIEDWALPDLRKLGEQKGFSGTIETEGRLFRWHRELDFRPPTGRIDEGIVRIEGDKLYEEGDPTAVLGVGYRETYSRKASGEQLRAALKLQDSSSNAFGIFDRKAFLILIDDHFMFALERPRSLPIAESLVELLERAEDVAAIKPLLDCEVSLGDLEGDKGAFRIFLSTLPWREGRALFKFSSVSVSGDLLSLDHGDGKSYWQIEDCGVAHSFLEEIFRLHAS